MVPKPCGVVLTEQNSRHTSESPGIEAVSPEGRLPAGFSEPQLLTGC